MTSNVSYLFASWKKDFKSAGPLKKSALRGLVSASDLLKLREGVIFTRDSFTRSGCQPRWFWIRTAQIQETRKGYMWSFMSPRTTHCPHPAAPLKGPSPKGTGPSTSALPHTGFPDPWQFELSLWYCSDGTRLVSLLPKVQRPWTKSVVGKYP